MGQHKYVLRTVSSRLHDAVQVFTLHEIDVLESELADLNARIRDIEATGRADPPDVLKAQAIALARRIDELRCCLRAHR